MNLYSIISVAATVLTFLAFLGIVAWAFSRRRAAAFAEAANAPFALPDDADPAVAAGQPAGRQP
jgi:cytochrome c oxidase cbb3-type subunit IV